MNTERPASPDLSLARRTMPKPAADESADPIYVSAPPPAAATPAASETPELTVPVSPAPVAPAPATPVAPAVTETPAPAVAPRPARVRRQEVFVQIGSRVTVETRDLLDDIIDREGLSMRHTLEKIIRHYHAQG